MRAVGVRRVRLDVSWAEVEPKQGEFAWTATDRVVRAARAAGLRILAVLCFEPPWARAYGADGARRPVDPELFASFSAAAATRRLARTARLMPR